MASATGLSILVAAFPEGKERNRALSVFAAASGSGFAARNDFRRRDYGNLGMEMGI